MGADSFGIRAVGETPQEAFRSACEKALYEYGHRGYTGTIAEKRSFLLLPVPAGTDPVQYAYELMAQNDSRIDSKWGPAGCVDLGPESGGRRHTYWFFGWASS